ncbi:MAG TPA: Ig-like domain-containing protein [Anaerolineaceae bacterium]
MIPLRKTRPFFSLLLACVLVISLLPPASQVQAAPTDLFFSEYIEGSSNNKALEIFNGTGAAIDLAAGQYVIQIYFNGATSATAYSLTGTLVNGDVFVFAHASAVASILDKADMTTSAGLWNGDDAIVLRKGGSGGTIIDSIGQVGFDPGTEWGTGLTSTADNTLRRKSTIQAGRTNSTDVFDPSIEWDGYATDTFNDLGSHTITAEDTAPSVTSTTPANSATNVAVNADIAINFSEPVNVSTGWFTISCASSGAHTAAVSGGPSSFTLNPDADFANNESCTVTVVAAQVADLDTNDPPDNMTANYTFSFTTVPVDACYLPDTPIGTVQGSGDATPLAGTTVTVQGVVVGDNEGASPALRGFYLQDTGDGDPTTSDGIFIYNNNNNNYVSVGQVVQVTGPVSEYQGQTQITQTVIVQCNATGSVQPVDVTLPLPSATYLERYEGMLVRFPQTLYVTEHYQLGRFGLVVMSADSRLAQPTNVVAPGAPALALQAANNLNRIIVDDDLQNQNPDPIKFGRGGNPLTASNTLRGGDTATGMIGVMTYTWAGNSASPNAYRLRPVNALAAVYRTSSPPMPARHPFLMSAAGSKWWG